MSDVATTVIGTVLGFGLGLIAQPITHGLTRWLNRRDTHNALYSELGLIYHLLSRVTDLSPEGSRASTDCEIERRTRAIQIFDSVDLDVFQHYSRAKADVFWSLPEASAFKRLYELLGAAIVERATGRDSWETTQGYINRWFTIIETYLREGTIDSEKLLVERANARDRTFKRLTAYYKTKEGPMIRDNRP